MFENVEKKLKTLAKVNLYCGFIMAGIFVIWVFWDSENVAIGWKLLFAVLFAVLWVLIGFITSWPIYAFAEMVEGIKETNKTLRYIFQDDIRKFQGIERDQERERQWAERQRQQEREEAARLARQAKKQKEDKIAAYWAEHSEEKKALLDKKAKAEALLKQVSGKERDTIQELIKSIDDELTRDR